MQIYNYENHVISNPLLPFIFHHCYTASRLSDPPNWHQNIELLYCISGKGYVKSGPESTPFHPGDIYVVNTDTPHTVVGEDCIQYRCLIIDNSFCNTNGIPISQLAFTPHISDPELRNAFDLVTAAYAQQNIHHICAIADIRYAVLGLLRILCQNYAIAEHRDVRTDEYVKKAILYIRQHLSETITLERIAAYVGISKFHLSRNFKTYTGSTIIEMINLMRCTEARQLIKSGMSVSHAAHSCGYENLSYFTKTFKKFFHVLPSSFIPHT